MKLPMPKVCLGIRVPVPKLSIVTMGIIGLAMSLATAAFGANPPPVIYSVVISGGYINITGTNFALSSNPIVTFNKGTVGTYSYSNSAIQADIPAGLTPGTTYLLSVTSGTLSSGP